MATYKGNDIAKPDPADEDLKLRGGRLPGMENIEEELRLPESNEPDYQPRPGQKGYKGSQHMADESKSNYDKFASDPERWSKVGRWGYDPDAPIATMKSQAPEPKKGSYTMPKMCGGGKVIKSWSK
jgi:hypothetical protein